MNTEQVQVARQRVLKVRTELVMSHRFYGVLVANVEPIVTTKVETAATDGKKHYWNPAAVAKWTQDNLLFVQAHETMHDALAHSSRRMGRDPKKWNEACDYAINIYLVDAKIGTPPPGILVDAKYRGWSAEEIYRARELDEQRAKQQQPQPQDESDDEESSGASGDSDDAEGDDADESGDQGDSAGDDEAGDEGDGDEAEGQGEGEGEGDDEGQGEGQGDGDADDDAGEAEGQGGGAGDGSDAEAGEAGEGQGGAAGDSEGDGEGAEGVQPVVGDVGGCGEVLDAAETPAENAAEEAKWERITRQAVSLAKAIGTLPGFMTQEIERSNTPTQNWREVLRAWFDQGALRSETWLRPNRRFVSSGLNLPGSRRDGVNKACFLIDTSASCDAAALAAVQEETQAALDDGAIDEAIVIYGDTRVTRVDTYRSGDEIEFDPKGRGGTDMKPLFQHVADEHSDASLIVCFTDMEIGDPGPQPHCPTLWAVHGYPDTVREYLKRTPWGEPGIDVGVH